jgi:hypothetical protein
MKKTRVKPGQLDEPTTRDMRLGEKKIQTKNIVKINKVQ